MGLTPLRVLSSLYACSFFLMPILEDWQKKKKKKCHIGSTDITLLGSLLRWTSYEFVFVIDSTSTLSPGGRWIRHKEAVMEKQVFLGGSSPSNDSSPVFASESLAFCISLERRNFSCKQWWTIAITRTTLPSEQQMSEGQKGNRVKSKLKLCRAYFEFYSVDLRRITWKLKWTKMSHMYWPKMCFNDTIWLQPFHPP